MKEILLSCSTKVSVRRKSEQGNGGKVEASLGMLRRGFNKVHKNRWKKERKGSNTAAEMKMQHTLTKGIQAHDSPVRMLGWRHNTLHAHFTQGLTSYLDGILNK